MNFHEACRAIMRCPKANGYAKTYADAGLYMTEHGDAARVQALYILNNIGAWRGPDAKAVRATLKEVAKSK